MRELHRGTSGMLNCLSSHKLLFTIMFLAGSLAAHATHAAVVVHDNRDGTFKWWTSVRYDGLEVLGTFLNITQSASEQTGERLPGSLGQWYRPNQSSSGAARRFFEGETEVEAATESKTLWWNGKWITPYAATREYFSGEYIAHDAIWNSQSNYFFHLPFSGSLSEGTPAISELAYIGVRTKLNGQWHYGWILFEDFMTPLMWAYETQPNTPIQIPVPVPSTAAIGVIACSWLGSSRRRK
jgi:hypothetical protein